MPEFHDQNYTASMLPAIVVSGSFACKCQVLMLYKIQQKSSRHG